MNRWKERRNQGKNIRLPQGAYSKQANNFQVHQRIMFQKEILMPRTYSMPFYIDSKPY